MSPCLYTVYFKLLVISTGKIFIEVALNVIYLAYWHIPIPGVEFGKGSFLVLISAHAHMVRAFFL